MDPQKDFEKKLNPSETETGLYNLESGVGIHARDDGCLELYAGGASILIDGETGTITLSGRKINQVAPMVNTLPSPAAMNIGTGSINPQWMPSQAESMAPGIVDDPRVNPAALERSPLVALNPTALETPLITGAPSYGQSIVLLGSLLKPKPMFKKPSRDKSMLEKIEQILRSLV